jgi:2-hydroxychromene-2-carboxylate isomerase
MTISFGATYDYRCPFARNAHEHIVTALRAGAPWDVDFVPFSLSQVHVEEDETPVWDDPDRSADHLALEVSLIVADEFPDRFLDLHVALFSARHDQARDLRDRTVVMDVLRSTGVDEASVMALFDDGAKHEELRKRHESVAASHQVWGVPTIISGEQAAFVRLMTRPNGDGDLAIATMERVLDLVTGHPDINELKHTTVPF